MKCIKTPVSGVLIFEPKMFGDSRGFFMETFRQQEFEEALAQDGQPAYSLVQDNFSRSARNVLRGLHYQVSSPQGKLVRVTQGEIFDVAVDIRPESTTYGRWFGQVLSGDNHLQMWIPPGLAHGFYVLSDIADVVYRCSDYYAPESERVLAWNHPGFAIEWPLNGEPLLSAKDKQAAMAFK